MSARAPEEQKTTRSTAASRDAARSKRTLGEDPAPAEGHSTKHLPRDYREINGWGADLDPKNRPMSTKELPSDVKTVRGDVKHWQKPPHKIHMSNEHVNLTPVFGTSCPPTGLSGRMRDYAFQFGEGTNRHWMTLLMADRVNMVEAMIFDAIRGKGDNFLREKGLSREERTRQYAVLGALALGALALTVILKRR